MFAATENSMTRCTLLDRSGISIVTMAMKIAGTYNRYIYTTIIIVDGLLVFLVQYCEGMGSQSTYRFMSSSRK